MDFERKLSFLFVRTL